MMIEEVVVVVVVKYMATRRETEWCRLLIPLVADVALNSSFVRGIKREIQNDWLASGAVVHFVLALQRDFWIFTSPFVTVNRRLSRQLENGEIYSFLRCTFAFRDSRNVRNTSP